MVALATLAGCHTRATPRPDPFQPVPECLPTTLPIVPTPDGIPPSWVSTPQTLVDVGRLTGANGKPVDRHLCGPPENPNGPVQPLSSAPISPTLYTSSTLPSVTVGGISNPLIFPGYNEFTPGAAIPFGGPQNSQIRR